ncbi:MAG: SPOR domain-containing protein [Rubrivivax sp.]
MALPPLLKPRAPDVANTSPMDVADVQARSRARRRLIGAAVLLLLGVVSFPLLFESQPRPVPVDTPMVIPSRDGAAPLQGPGKGQDRSASGSVVMAEPAVPTASGATAAVLAATAVVPAATVAGAAGPAPAAAAHPGVAAQPPTVATAATPAPQATPNPVPAPPAPAASSVKPAVKPEVKADTKALPKAEPKPEPKPAPNAGTKADTKADMKSGTRFVVQVGAYADEASAKDVRLRVEKLGFKTFTQDVQTPNGRRIRVRIGPFDSQAEAQKALERLKGSKLPGAVLTL